MNTETKQSSDPVVLDADAPVLDDPIAWNIGDEDAEDSKVGESNLDWRDFLVSDLIEGLDADARLPAEQPGVVNGNDLTNIEPLPLKIEPVNRSPASVPQAIPASPINNHKAAKRSLGTGPSRRAKNNKKHKGMPKRPLSAYNLFFQCERYKVFEEARALEGPHLGYEMLGKIMGQRWKEMGEAERDKYNKLSAIDALRFRKEMKEYERKLSQQEKDVDDDDDDDANNTSSIAPEKKEPKAKKSTEKQAKEPSKSASKSSIQDARLLLSSRESTSFDEDSPMSVSTSTSVEGEAEAEPTTPMVRRVSDSETLSPSSSAPSRSVSWEAFVPGSIPLPHSAPPSAYPSRFSSSSYEAKHPQGTMETAPATPYRATYPPGPPPRVYVPHTPPPPVPLLPRSSEPSWFPAASMPPPPPPLWQPLRMPVHHGMHVRLPDPQTGVERGYQVQYKCYRMTRTAADAYLAACCGSGGGDQSSNSSVTSSNQSDDHHRAAPHTFAAHHQMSLEQLLRTPLPPGSQEIVFPQQQQQQRVDAAAAPRSV